MFVCKKTNRSGTISVVVVSKARDKFTEVKKFGVAKSETEAEKLFQEAQLWLRTHDGQQEFDFDDRRGKELEETTRVVENMDSVLLFSSLGHPNQRAAFSTSSHNRLCSLSIPKMTRLRVCDIWWV